MAGKAVVGLYYESACSGGCSCGADPNFVKFTSIAGELAEKFGEERLKFEAFKSLDAKRFPFLSSAAGESGKIDSPVVVINEKIFAKGRLPSTAEFERELKPILK